VRELRNMLERAALLSDGPVIGARQIAAALDADSIARVGEATAQPEGAWPAMDRLPEGSLRKAGDELIKEQLSRHRGSRAQLARKLGISERSLYRRLRRLAQGEVG